MHSLHLRTLCCTTLLLLSVTDRSSAADDFQPMFNGKDLSGWVLTNTPYQTWTFQDGLLVCTGKPIGELRTEKMYQNFIMELEWRHMVPRGNAGVFVWADDITSRGVPFHRGIEVQVLEDAYGNSKGHTVHGDIFPIHGATMTPINGRGGSRAFTTENRSKPSPQWNHYRIECRDGKISLAVNGKVVTQGKDCSPRKGYICLESEGGIVHYRNVRIQELPSSDLPPEQIAIANRGYQSLYTGLNLVGWQLPEGASRWEPKDWILTHDGSPDDSSSLSSKKFFSNIGFVVDVRFKHGSGNVVIDAGDDVHLDLSDPIFAKHLEKLGRWNRIELSSDAGKSFLLINKKKVDLPYRKIDGEVAGLTLKATGKVDFCNLYGRSMEAE